MSKKKVLLLGWEFPPMVNGGLGVATYGLAKALSAHVEITAILPKATDALAEAKVIGLDQQNLSELKEKKATTSITEFAQSHHLDLNLEPYVVARPLDGTTSSTQTETVYYEEETLENLFREAELYGPHIIPKVVQFARYAKQIAMDQHFDVIYAHDWMTALAGIEIKHETGKPLVLHIHSLDYDRGGPDSRSWIYDLEKAALAYADKIIAVSHYTAQILEMHYGVDADNIEVVHNGAAPIKAAHAEKTIPEKVVLFLGRVTNQKGPEHFLDIAEAILEKKKKVRFVVAGSGDQLRQMIEDGAYRNIGDKVTFTGQLSMEKVRELLSLTDLYVMPSHSEPFGLTALEAAQHGIPMVLSRQSGAAEVLPGALKADAWLVDQLAEHAVVLLSDKRKRDKCIRDNTKALQKLTWEASAKKVLKVFAAA